MRENALIVVMRRRLPTCGRQSSPIDTGRLSGPSLHFPSAGIPDTGYGALLFDLGTGRPAQVPMLA